MPDAKSVKLAAQDEEVVESVQAGSSQHLFLEYLEWMGREPLSGKDEGRLHCPSCKKVLGRWSWGGDRHSGSTGGKICPLEIGIILATLDLAH